jgi:ferredoxin
MHSVDALSRAAIVADCDWARFSRFIDVGGAYGSVLNALLLAVPGSTGAHMSWQAGASMPAARCQHVGMCAARCPSCCIPAHA